MSQNSLDLPQVFELAFIFYYNLLAHAPEGFSRRLDLPLVAKPGLGGCFRMTKIAPVRSEKGPFI
jgi:hypothetical protein